MQTNILSWIRKLQFSIQLFVALMVNMMVFSQPISYAIQNKQLNKVHYYISGNSATSLVDNNVNEVNTTIDNKLENEDVKKSQVVVTTQSNNDNTEDTNEILAIERQGVIGKSENLPIDELTDNIFRFELKNEIKQNKDIYLEYELFGLAEANQATKSINDQFATGGSIIKTNKIWTKVREKVNPNDLQKGNNFIKFTTWENSQYQYMVRNLKMVYEDKIDTNNIVFHQNEANSYNGKIAFSGFIEDNNISKISVLGNEFPVLNGVFEVLVEEKQPNANLVVSYIDSEGAAKENTIKINQLLETPTALYKNKKEITSIKKDFEKGIVNNLTFWGATLNVEESSLIENATFSIAGLRYVDLPTLSPEMVNVTADYYGYRMLPHGEHFTTKPAKLHLKYDEKKLPTGYTAKDIKTFYFDNEQKKWMALEKDTLLSTTQEIVSKTTHFTDFINGIIKVPESPETGSYTPTSIKDIKAADPTAGVVSIVPPSPNNMGTVNTSFPIKLPTGRSGMQPSLSVDYNSEGGNGWMGLGWDMSIPGVSLDTRWGAPRYDSNLETEIYSMGGGMLTLKDGDDYTNPHRKDNIVRQSERQFYPRIEGSYAKVIRHGSNPTNYWWEVTDKMGNKSFYGGYSGAVVTNAVVKTNSGNIAYWGLYRTEDTNGNYVEYIYDNQIASIAGDATGNGGNEFYIKEIKYTLHNSSSQNNYYKVSFNRSNNYTVGTPSSYPQRQDIQINARNGVVQVTRDLLKEVKISFEQSGNSQIIRTYRFDYEEHAFIKSQLTKVSEYDASGDLFYSNTLEYFNKGTDGTSVNNSSIMETQIRNNWNGSGNSIKGNLLSSFIAGEFSNEGSVLGASKSYGLNGNLFAGVGFPCTWTRLLNIGINGGYNHSNSEVLISFTDINGDGLPDKVFKSGDNLYFRPNYGLTHSLSGFGSAQLINGISKISESSSDSYSVGIQASLIAFAGYTYNKSISTTKTYFSDVNGDGLIDLVDRKNIKLNQTLGNNYLNSVNFDQNTGKTSNPVGSGVISSQISQNVVLPTLIQINDENPIHDIVKVWTAPVTGTISITGNATLNLYPPTAAEPYPLPGSTYFSDHDGVRLSIQKNTTSFPSTTPGAILLDKTIDPTFTASGSINSASQNMDISSLLVQKGDRLYFRVQSRNEGSYDRVQWNPTILYSGPDQTNIDGISYFSSAANEGFILSGLSTTVVPVSGGITISWPGLTNIPAYTFSDNITFKIERGIIDPSTGEFNLQQTYLKTLDQNSIDSVTPINFSPSLPTSVGPNTAFRFYVSADSNVDWKAINWQPVITQGTNVQHAVVDYNIFAKKINNVLPTVNGLNTSPVIIKPVFNANAFNSLPDGSYNFRVVVKNSNRRVIGVSTNDIVVDVNAGLATLSNTTDPNFYNFSINDYITATINVEIYTNYEKAAIIGALATQPITVQIHQANNINFPSPITPYSIPTTTATLIPRFISAISFGGANPIGFNATGLTATPYYENLSTPIKSFVGGTNQNLVINSNSSSSRVGVWIDWDKDGQINNTIGQEFFLGLGDEVNIPIIIPNVTFLQDGLIKVRIRAGLRSIIGATHYQPLTFNNDNIDGTVRDFWINLVSNIHVGTVRDIYAVVENKLLGQQYRGWGQFAYHGGIKIKRGKDLNGDGNIDTTQEEQTVVLDASGNPIVLENYGYIGSAINPIDEGVLNNDDLNTIATNCQGLTDPQLIQNCLQQNNSNSIFSRRFFSLTADELENRYFGANHNINVDDFNFSASRFGVKNINTIYEPPIAGGNISSNCDFTPLNHGISLINKGDGDSTSGGVSLGGFGGSTNYSTSFNWADTSFMDMNGDKYPDILTENFVQFTGLNGGLAETIGLGYGRVSTGSNSSWGAGASGTFKKSNAPENKGDQSKSQGNSAAVSASPNPQLQSSGNASANIGGGTNTEKTLWIDMNGDGLPDRVIADGNITVQLNLGYSLGNPQVWQYGSDELSGKQSNFSGGAGYSFADNTIGGGISVAASKAWTEKNIQDINGDGLPDLLLDNSDGNFSYRINGGNAFSSNIFSSNVGGYINFSRGTSEGVNGSYTQVFPIIIPFIPPICIQVSVGGGAGFDHSLNRTENILDDINGDGFVDILNAGGGTASEGDLSVRLSKIGKTNLLRKVNTPTGGSWEVAYERVGNTFEFAQSKYVLSTIKTFDGFTTDNNWSNDRNVTSVKYENPYYDRREREFFGFDKVKVNQHGGFNTDINIQATNPTLPTVYRYSVQEFHNNNYYLKGAVKKETLFDANNVVWTENTTTYGIFLPETVLTESITRPSLFTNTSYNISSVDENTIKYGSNVITSNSGNHQNFICTDLDKFSLFVTPLVSVKTFTEGDTNSANWKYAVTVMEAFDSHGNIKQYRDYGEQNADVYVTKINYYPSISGVSNSLGFPEYIRVFDANGTTLKRERKAIYLAGTGNLENVITKLNTTQDATVSMQYNTYGNLSKVTHENSVDASGNKFFREYTYDDVVHTYPTVVNDAFGYSSSSTYNYLFGIPVYTTDMNLQPMRTRIDDRGRPIEITGPYELFVEGVTGGSDVGWTIRFEYQSETAVAAIVNGTSLDDDNYTKIYNASGNFLAIAPDNNDSNDPTNKLHHALTRHFDPEYRASEESVTTANQILTSTLSDGFGKPVQVKKMFARHLAATAGNSPSATNNVIEWLLAGKVKQDAFGRAIESYYPTTQTGNFADFNNTTAMNAFVYDNSADNVAPTTTTYDVLDRSLTTQLPGETEETTMTYGFENNNFLTTVTNELGQVQKSFTDVRGRTTQTLQESLTGNIPTNFEYNNIGELLKVIDVAGNETFSSYDLAGRRTELLHPDNGITKFTYDQASNLTKRETSNLLNAGNNEAIEYKYTYNRLDEINYPQFPENKVNYYYGTAGNSDAANDNAVGKLWYHVDATGTQYMKYGKLGELTLNRRSVAVPGDRVYWFQTEWTYDTWNRVKTIKYPDEEVVTYKYNKGGELHAMTSDKNGAANKDIISQLGYDKFGQRTYLRYGNGTETTYDYQAERRRLDRMKIKSTATYGAASNREFVNNKYNYDVLSNVLSIQNNTVPTPTATQIGGRSWQEYTYDDLNRLTTASGNFVGRNDDGVGFNHSKYTLAMSYDSQHNITSKIQNHESATSTSASSVAGAWTQVENTSYNLNYQDYNTASYSVAGYDYAQPHAPRTIIDQPNLAGCCDGANDPRVKTKSYEYDANGNQTRVTSTICTNETPDILRENLWDEENRLRAIDLNPEANTVHPIAIYTYDAGGERIIKQNATSVAIYENALQVGTAIKNDFMLYPSGMLVARPAADGTGALSYTKHYFAGSQRVSSKIGTTSNLGKVLQEWTLLENSSGGAPINLVSTSHDQLAVAETGVTHVYTAFGITPTPTFSSNTAFIAIPAFTGTEAETEQYYFHPDHLGSSNYITNFIGEVSQHMEYFAFGETFIEEHKNSHNAPYKYNGKEFDEESGLYYYGARYYDPRISIWTSVDPYSFSIDYFKNDSANGGVFYSKNLSVYSYSYLNPILYKDPDGKIPALVGAVVGILTEILAQLGVNMLVEHQDLSTAWSNLDKSDIFVAGVLGAATGFFDGGTSRLVTFLSNPRNQKLMTKVVPLVVDLIVELIEGVAKNVLNLEEGESLDIKGALYGALTEVGLKQLAGFFKTSKKLTNKLDKLEKVAEKDIKKAQKEIDRGSKKVKYKNRVEAGNKKIDAINTTRGFLDIPKSAVGEGGSNVKYENGKIIKK